MGEEEGIMGASGEIETSGSSLHRARQTANTAAVVQRK